MNSWSKIWRGYSAAKIMSPYSHTVVSDCLTIAGYDYLKNNIFLLCQDRGYISVFCQDRGYISVAS